MRHKKEPKIWGIFFFSNCNHLEYSQGKNKFSYFSSYQGKGVTASPSLQYEQHPASQLPIIINKMERLMNDVALSHKTR